MSTPSSQPIPEEPTPQQLVTLSASVILTALPSDSAAVLSKYSNVPTGKITIRLRPIGSSPILKQLVYRISGNQKFSAVVNFIRKQLHLSTSESLFCYVNSSFAPGLDEYIVNLHRAFGIDGQLIVSYCKTVAFG